jgi:hypothetical protein
MFYKANVAVCSEIRTEHINAMWAPRRLLILNLVVCEVTARLWKVKWISLLFDFSIFKCMSVSGDFK